MRIGVIGAGAVGGTIAALLDRAGHEVEVTARGASVDVIRSRGITLSGGWGDHVARPKAGEKLSYGLQLVFLTTKAADAAAALEANAHALEGVPLVVVQNGLTGMGTAAESAPRSPLIGALAMFAASHLEPGVVTVTTANSIYVGGDDPVSVNLAAATLREVIPTFVVRDFEGAQWTKIIINQINALPAITGLSAQDTISHRGLRFVLTRSIREAVQVGIGNGVRFERMQALSHPLLRIFAAQPLWVGQLLPLVMKWRLGPTPNPGSTLQSIRRGQKTEIDYLHGAVVDAAAEVGMKAPVNATLVGLVHAVEDTGEFFTPEQVVAEVAAALSPVE
ncbi:MAG: 2-dehydropantoate 2-reductase [Cryobacterium sp.]|nr:2-dehydropantoate 2-reductase [Cryobacterium sp.]